VHDQVEQVQDCRSKKDAPVHAVKNAPMHVVKN
ncbi:hypothetical protein A2U01_0029802, partial [Trifolium medium]|nr:hypothetical protein [Trifolium medium]